MPKITITVGERVIGEIEVSDKVAGEIAVDIVGNFLELQSNNKEASAEKMKLSKALIEATKKS